MITITITITIKGKNKDNVKITSVLKKWVHIIESESESLSGIHNGFDFVPALGIANNIIKM